MKDPELRYKLPKVRDVMSSRVIALTEDHSVYDALVSFNKYSYSAIPVVKDKSNLLVGVISEGDCLKYLAENLFYDELTDDTLRPLIKRNVSSISRDVDIFQLEEFFQTQGIRHAPVVEEGRVVGVVSRSDILRHLEKFIGEVMKHRKDVIDPLELSKYKEFDTRTEEIKEKHKFDYLT